MDSVEQGSAVEMSTEVYVAAVEGNLQFLQQTQNDAYLLTKTYENNTIIHIAVQHERYEFILQSLQRFPQNRLICEKNSSGNMPLHVAAEVGNSRIVTLLCEYCAEYEGDDDKPWRLKNLKGNTPIHVAIMHHNVMIATFLLEIDSTLARMLNVLKETPLHLAIKHHVNYSESESVMAKIKQPIDEGGAALATNYVLGEDMSSVIKLLIEKGSCVTCWPDAKGMTPLHAAASLSTPYNLEVIRSILQHCPQSAEVCDKIGKSILHLLISKIPSYQEGKNLLRFKEIYALRNHQDHQGDTPLHLAARNMDIIMVQVLLESSVKLSIKNIEGVSVASFTQQQKLFEMLRKRKMTWTESEAADKANIIFLRDRMSKLGSTVFLHSQDSQGRNVLHKLIHIKKETHIIYDDFVDFIQQVVASFPGLICQTDHNGDTPIHVLVRNRSKTKIYVAKCSPNKNDSPDYTSSSLSKLGLLSVLLELCSQCMPKVGTITKPWLVQNSKGNTPLHEAIIANNNTLVAKLLNLDTESAGILNNSEEAPLHLLAGYTDSWEPLKEDIELMVNAEVKATHWQDKDGLTPLLRATHSGNFFTAKTLCSIDPHSADIRNANGQLFWHLLVNHPSNYYVKLLLKNSNIRPSLYSKDKNGNTMLHLAIEGNRFDIVKIFFEVWENEKNSTNGKRLLNLLNIQNKAGKTPADLIGESTWLPTDVEKYIKNNKEMLGVRSVWRIPTVQLSNYVSTMAIIAALITTITFTTAFAVPGGLFQDKGTPIFLEKKAFQVFMISDVVAMCLSMIVLFCLLLIWTLPADDRQNSLMILDLTVSLLVASFYATLLTFMTGLYAVMYPIKPWIAYVTLGLCSLFMLLAHKIFVLKVLIPLVKRFTVFRWRLRDFTNKLCKKLAPRRTNERNWVIHV